MKLETAIERVQGSLDHNTILITCGDKDALRLLLEAGKREKANRDNPDLVLVGPLPGETE